MTSPFLTCTFILKNFFKNGLNTSAQAFNLTVIEVNVFGDLVPGSVVEVANLLLVLHHTSRFAFFLVLQSNVILYGLKVLPVLRQKARDTTFRFVNKRAHFKAYYKKIYI